MPRHRFFFILATLLLGFAPLSAQEGWIVVSEPGEWSDQRMLTIGAGTRIRVVGQSFHPSGVRTIRVGAQEATIRPGAGGVVDFEVSFLAAGQQNEVVITMQPVSGTPVTRTMPITVTGAAGGGAPPGQPAAQPVTPPATPRSSTLPSGGSVIATSILLPGTGQIRTQRMPLGLLFLAGAAGSIAVGVLSKKTTVSCRSGPVNGACPPGEVAGQEVSKPLLIPGALGFVALGVASGLEAASYVGRQSGGGGGGAGMQNQLATLPAVRVTLLKLRF